MLGLAEASKHENEEDMIFMAGTWSRCPAEKWVPALLEGIWNRPRNNPSERHEIIPAKGRPLHQAGPVEISNPFGIVNHRHKFGHSEILVFRDS